MDQAFTDEMKAALLKEQMELTGELGAISHKDVGDHVPGSRDANFPNFGDDNLGENTESPAEVAEYEVNVNVTGRLEQRQVEITDALKRIEQGIYGTCLKCGGPVGEDRLRANSAASACINCAKSHV
ncbi:MAG: hypothetical protein COW24_06135 [Candidatus Kerfeldbacteria bacterium CG15_BIG_FIL_POST_REV_8_21_14_020_45_12]|uniref:Zinc finger DksA/TraR C4-type domain-containing protein n=1 Tax=Candidatus Kerfeldbacteria bacterium CG15_BIG_FIL_POST_REV_8_21_14_020_45_12 TaxID=2014247 RepID=A0A2M7H246_9BACT|nr:MAG: hypothetical protein COW24_06135 [Candidatus Kerfeldbacteria bacterium CG15_BIG_FIL_POST_REV_8_21_14_020_45_12]PJA92877.1 MAG: hypothetical protein CO132_05775 [Candidatus Kerfeldbacteria bacterium CG_4_9_14_3_um_filter_45_8]